MTGDPEICAPDLVARVERWMAADPDPAARAELRALLVAGDTGELCDRFSTHLQFGTAGLRGRLGAGPNRMNRAVVIRAAAGLTAYLRDRLADVGEPPCPRVVIGFDARHGSRRFAHDTAAVVTAAGGHVTVFAQLGPTPLLAFAVRHLAADAGVMVTASHNPASDNGLKVYLGGRMAAEPADGVQIVPPADAEIAAQIAAAPGAIDVPRSDGGWVTAGASLGEAYLAAAAASPAGLPRSTAGVAAGGGDGREALRIVTTFMHGVGAALTLPAFAQAGFTDVIPVPDQREPDPDFPTVGVPNPEEPGAGDHAFDLARRVQADLVIASDPDADRCAVALHDPRVGDYRMLTGDEVGSVLGLRAAIVHSVLSGGGSGEPATVASSIVSSRLLPAIAAAYGLRHRVTLTGFKWIARTAGLVFGYEEAMGYCVRPDMVRDKDGITAGLAVAEVAAGLKARGLTLLDLLDDLARTFGLHLTGQVTASFTSTDQIAATMARLAAHPPRELAGSPIVAVSDLSEGSFGLPPTPGTLWTLADASRVIVRPSGTEPKVKCYLEVIEQVPSDATYDDITAIRSLAARRLAALADAVRI
ncbi:MAG: phospho-sugar mutase [Bifidobacteriaceae bacterium]|jgi:phosphomannomutase|nr:phospho-sugar mutase [Bifidobacteriaceae bacterium]